MTSNIAYSTINEAFPVAGTDNDSQGFRDNFAIIKTGLQTAKTEIDTIHSKALLSSTISGNNPVDNNLLGSTLSNGILSEMTENTNITVSPVSTTADISYSDGQLQFFTLSGDTTFTFKNWPTTGKYAKIRVHMKSDGSSRTPTLATSGGTLVSEGSLPSLVLNANEKHKVIEAWTYDGGLRVYIRYLGEF